MQVSRWVFIALVITLAVFVVSSGVLAALLYQRNFALHFNVQAAPGLEIYADASTNTPLSAIDFGDVQKGGSYSKMIYVGNTGNVNFTNITTNSDLPLDWGSVTAPVIPSLVVNQRLPLTLTLSIEQTAAIQDYESNIVRLSADYE